MLFRTERRPVTQAATEIKTNVKTRTMIGTGPCGPPGPARRLSRPTATRCQPQPRSQSQLWRHRHRTDTTDTCSAVPRAELGR